MGDAVALEALTRRSVPPESAAEMAIAEAPTSQLAVLNPQLLDTLAAAGSDLEDEEGSTAW